MNIDQNKQLLSRLLLRNLIKKICYVHKILCWGTKNKDMAHWGKKHEQVFIYTDEGIVRGLELLMNTRIDDDVTFHGMINL
jgi:hypothetical protein